MSASQSQHVICSIDELVINWGKRFLRHLLGVVRLLCFIRATFKEVVVKARSLTGCEIIFKKMKNNLESTAKVGGCTRSKVACDITIPYLLIFFFSLVIVRWYIILVIMKNFRFFFVKLSLPVLSKPKVLMMASHLRTAEYASSFCVNFVKTDSPVHKSSSR